MLEMEHDWNNKGCLFITLLEYSRECTGGTTGMEERLLVDARLEQDAARMKTENERVLTRVRSRHGRSVTHGP